MRTRGAGYVDYQWQWKSHRDGEVPKLSYVKGFEPWGWIVGTGVYIEDVQDEIANVTRRMHFIFTGILAILLVLAVYTVIQSRKAVRERTLARKSPRSERGAVPRARGNHE